MTSQPVLTTIAKDSPRHKPAFATGREFSEDAKLTIAPRERPVSATYVSQHSCGPCPFKNGNGCMAEAGRLRWTTARLNASGPASPEVLAEAHAAEIDKLTGRWPLRLDVVGDAMTSTAARIISTAVQRYKARFGQVAWGYTHQWRTVDREAWQDTSILASCETEADVALATQRGYATAIVINADDVVPERIAGLKPLLCLKESGAKLDCEDCRACTFDDRLRGHAVIVFLGKGPVRKLREALRKRNEEV